MTVDTAEAATPVVDTARPWPGLDAFTEALSPFFFGRDAEADELFRRVRRDLVTLLFGQSGLGKTSLLQAGLFPRLRQERFLPILIRLDYSTGAPSPTAQVKAAIEREFAMADLSEATPIGAEESLWGYFHRVDRRLADRAGKEIPVLVFDQFEEIFTQGLAGDDSRTASQSFFGELAELIENRPPEKLEQEIEANPDLVEDYLFDRQDYRIVLALREDFLASLESLRSRAPSLGHNRYRLRRMTGRQGLDAILNPAPGLVAPAVAQEIIRFIGSANPEDAFGVAGPAGSAEGFEVEPSLLSLVCRELNERRIARELDQIGADLLAGSRDDIIEGFYERVLADQPGAALRTFVEDRLLSDSGFRESITLDSARRALIDAGVPATALDQLVRRRLLRIEERLDVARVEIIHDVLTPVIRRSRDTRHLRQAEAAAAEREAALRREQQRARRAYWFAAAMALLALATVGLAGWAWISSVEAERQRELAELEQRRAEDQRKRAEQNFDIALTSADAMVTAVAERLRPIAGVSAQTVRDVLTTAESLFERLAGTAQNSPDLRWRRASMLISFAYTYQTLGDNEEAVRRARAAREIMLSLVDEEPANNQRQATLGISFRALGDGLCASEFSCPGDLTGALSEYRKGLAIVKGLTEQDAENPAWQDELARAHFGIGNVLIYQGALPEAISEYRIGLEIQRRLTQKDPTNVDWLSKLATFHGGVAGVLHAQGDLAAALTEYRGALDIASSLAQKDPGNARWQRDLADKHQGVGDVLGEQGDTTAALFEHRVALDVLQHLAKKDPGNAQWENRVAVAHQRVGHWLLAENDRAAALSEFRIGLEILRRLTQKDPKNTLWVNNLGVFQGRVGDMLYQQDHFSAALTEYRAHLDIFRGLVEKDASHTVWQRNLSLGHTKVGQVLHAQGDLAAALTEYRAALDITLRLAEKDPTNVGWQRDLSANHENVGVVLRDQGDLAGALGEYGAALDIAQRLAAKDPGNVQWERDLFVVYTQIGLVAYRRNDFQAALNAFEKAEKIALHVKVINPTAATSARDLHWVQTQLEETRRKIAGSAAAGNRKR